MHLVLLIGIQASGKSTFSKERFFDTHLRLNLDTLRTRHREERLMAVCLETQMPFVVDNTNVTRAERARYIVPAKAASYRITGYFMQCRIDDSLRRNEARDRKVPPAGIRSTRNRLEVPTLDEGFDELFFVQVADTGFIVEPWRIEP